MTEKSPVILPAAGTDQTLPRVALADIVRLKKPYFPSRRYEEQTGQFSLGIVAEVLSVLPNGSPRNASLYLYDPQRRVIYLGPQRNRLSSRRV